MWCSHLVSSMCPCRPCSSFPSSDQVLSVAPALPSLCVCCVMAPGPGGFFGFFVAVVQPRVRAHFLSLATTISEPVLSSRCQPSSPLLRRPFCDCLQTGVAPCCLHSLLASMLIIGLFPSSSPLRLAWVLCCFVNSEEAHRRVFTALPLLSGLETFDCH